MMKTFDLFKLCKKNFSVKKYIKPTFNQEYYNAIHSQRYKDKVTEFILKFKFFNLEKSIEKYSWAGNISNESSTTS